VNRASRPASRRLVAALGAGVVVATSGAVLTPTESLASSHREAPLIAGDPRADNTDTYAFVSPDKPDTVTLIANWIPFEEPNGGPNFYPFATHATYNIKIDNNGDGVADVTYTWSFANHYRDDAGQFLYNTGVVNNLTDKTLNFYQSYDLIETTAQGRKVLLRNAIVAPSNVGAASMPDYSRLRDQSIARGQFENGKGQSYVGQADDPFFLDLRVFDLLYGANLQEAGHDTLSGFNVNTIALQVPKSDLALKGNATRNPVIGVWSTTDRKSVTTTTSNGPQYGGHYVQVSRLGNPLVNEVVVPLKYKDAFNAINPSVDHTVKPVVAAVLDPIVPKLVQAIYGIPAPATPRTDLAEIFLKGICKACGPIQADLNSQLLNKDVSAGKFVPSEELRLNMAVAPTAQPNRLGVIGGDVQGFPNGRRLGDDVIDIALQVMEGAARTGQLVPALAKGDGVDANDVAFGTTFPYVALPHTAAANTGSAGSATTSAAVHTQSHGSNDTARTAALGSVAGMAALLAIVMVRRRRTTA
jgi:hypothetical protein